MTTYRLTISLLWADSPPAPGTAAIGESRGGRQTLLRWLETQLGLQRKFEAQTTRIVRYGAQLLKANRPSYANSLKADLWGTAKALLARRDGLRLLGWDGRDEKSLPPLARDLAAVESLGAPDPSEADRLAGVLAVLTAGQQLPEHELVLREPVEAWPAAWRPILGKLSMRVELGKPSASAGKGLVPEKNLTWWRALSVVAAAEAAAAVLAALGGEASETTVLCEDGRLAAVLDDALAARGVPPMGVIPTTTAHPVLQVLPLALGLLWEPANPELVLDFLLLSVSPIPPSWARKLAEALAQRPGVGSQSWNETLDALDKRDPEAAKDRRERVRFWISSPAGKSGEALSQAAVADRCGKIAQWALSRSAMKSELAAESLLQLAAQASALAELALAFPTSLSEPQLQRLVSTVQEGGVRADGHPTGARGPRWIQSLAELDRPCPRLIWFGVHSEGTASSPWSAADARALSKACLDMDFIERLHSLQRDAERLGLRRVSGPVLAIQLATATDVPLHPLWLELGTTFGHRKAAPLDEVLAKGGTEKPWPLHAEERNVQPPTQPPLIWEVDPTQLKDISTTSAGEIEMRLGCPLKWTFQYAAKLRASTISKLPDGVKLKGTLSHDILEDVFGKSRPTTADEAERIVGEIFERRVATDAATLARPAAARQRLELNAQLGLAARAFFDLLRRGRYEIVGFEITPGGKLLGRDFNGRLDCVLKAEDGSPALIDLKYSGTSKYRELLETGKAIQLAVYSAALAQGGSNERLERMAAGYFIVDRARLFTPAQGGLNGAQEEELVTQAPSLAQVWRDLASALQGAEAWLESGEIPARPLQNPEDWPKGVTMALREVDASRYSGFKGLSECQYCHYPRLCGKEPVS